MQRPVRTRTTLLQKILLVSSSVCLTFAILALVGHCIKINGKSINQKIYLNAWVFKNNHWPAKIGIYQSDPVYGWRHIPGAEGRHCAPYTFDVAYTIDSLGHRATPNDYHLPKALFLGCSFTFGHGVEDGKTYSALLATQLPSHKMVNAATNAWGTVQAWLKLQECLNSMDDVQLVVYGFIGHHRQRNYRRQTWLDCLEPWGRCNPAVEWENGKLANKGLWAQHRDGLENGPALEAKEKDLTLHLIADMQRLCLEKQIPFLLAYLPDDHYLDFAGEIKGIIKPGYFLDLRNLISLDTVMNKLDGHPNATGHVLMAKALEPVLDTILF